MARSLAGARGSALAGNISASSVLAENIWVMHTLGELGERSAQIDRGIVSCRLSRLSPFVLAKEFLARVMFRLVKLFAIRVRGGNTLVPKMRSIFFILNFLNKHFVYG